jgi:sirohydrochlorin ferrochelatase
MEALLLFSHGSVLCGSERGLLDLAGGLALDGTFPIVEAGFLNYSEPRFEQAVERCVELGATAICVAPFFLVAGKFVLNELEPRIAAMKERFPDLEFTLTSAIGFHPRLADAIVGAAETAMPPGELPKISIEESQCRRDPKCPLYESPACPATAE